MPYNKFPKTTVKSKGISGYENIIKELKEKIVAENIKTVVIDCYPGVRYDELYNNLIVHLNPSCVIFSDELTLLKEDINQRIKGNITDDRVFGTLSSHKLIEFFDKDKISKAKQQLDRVGQLSVVYGVGASYVTTDALIIYADLARWEIQYRYRTGELSNWLMDNKDEDILRKYKYGFFWEWRISDHHKVKVLKKMTYYLDTNLKENPKMITKESFLKAMDTVVKGPFRTVPYFDPGVWGGQWMKEVCDLDKSKSNFAWSFDGVPEENSLIFDFDGVELEMPAINLVFLHPKKLLGEKVFARFGAEFPIRFDFLDTMGGQNLSLQVHPTTDYIQNNFGMHYTQDESYYILDAMDNAKVYLGTKTGINPDDMINDLHIAEIGKESFCDEKYINQFSAKKHDHFLIPAGTIHCSGANTMVLEISATPYIFTFKLWDWDRLGLDNRPRPVHIDHGKENICWERDTDWVSKNIINAVEVVAKGDGWVEEKTGLHHLQFIETRRHWFSKKVAHSTCNSVNVLNLIEGTQAVVESPNGDFEPFIINYAETFIIPESVKEYTISPYGESLNKTIATIKAYVRTYNA